MELKKHFLRQFFGSQAIPQEVPSDAEDHSLMLFDNFRKGRQRCGSPFVDTARDKCCQQVSCAPFTISLRKKEVLRFKNIRRACLSRQCSCFGVVRFLQVLQYTGKVEYAHERKIRARNKFWYRVAHWPIWIWVFFLAPGPLTFELFAFGPSGKNLIWLVIVLAGTCVAGFYGQLPGVESKPYILRFCEDKPNPVYRRVCYTFAWNALLSFALLNLLGLVVAVITGEWRLRQIYSSWYAPICLAVLAAGLLAVLPRVRRSTVNEGIERRYFYGTVWAVTAAQLTLMVLWKALPRSHSSDVMKLSAYLAVLFVVGVAAVRGRLPRTKPILPGELMVAD